MKKEKNILSNERLSYMAMDMKKSLDIKKFVLFQH